MQRRQLAANSACRRVVWSARLTCAVCAGVPNATARLLQQQYVRRRTDAPMPVDLLVPPAQRLTDPDNWERVQQSLQAAGVAVLLAASHPVLLPPIASTSALAAAAVQGLTASAAVQRAAAAATALAQHAALRKRALLSSCAVTLAGAGASGASAPHLAGPLRAAEDARAVVAGGIAHGMHRMHRAATACAAHTRSVAHGLLGPLAPFNVGVNSRLASLSTMTPVEAAVVPPGDAPHACSRTQVGVMAVPARPRRVKPVVAHRPRHDAAALRMACSDRALPGCPCIGR